MAERAHDNELYDNHGEIELAGSSNTYTATSARAIVGYYKGLRLSAKANHTNTGASTIALNSMSAVAIRKHGTAALVGGEIVSGQYYDFEYDAANGIMQILNPSIGDGSITNAQLANMAQSTIKGRAEGAGTGAPQDLTPEQARDVLGAREPLAANRTYYVRTDGSDSNDGLADSAGGAFLTIQKAITTVYGLDIAAFNVEIEVRDGTYTGAIALVGPWLGTGAVSINGQSASGTIISVTSANCFSASDSARLIVNDVELRTTTSGKCLFVDTSSVIIFSGIRFGACASHHIEASNSGVISASGNYSIVGSAVSHLHAPFGGFINISGVTVTLSGTPAFSGFFAGVSGPSNITAVSTTFSGSATGVRYIIYKSGHIETGGGNPASYFPGNAAGALGSGGTLDLLPMVDTAYTVTNLPAASLFAGARALVVDANATTFASVVAGGGANIVPVYSTGSNWVIG